MNDKPLKSCSKESCNECEIHSKVTCHFNPGQFVQFYLILLLPLTTGSFGVYNYSSNSFIIWVMTFPLFFLLLGIRVLCTHCPHYKESSRIIRCWANYGVPKLWKYRPTPMNFYEKAILISGFIFIWGFPVIFISLTQEWILLSGYLISVFLFFFLLNRISCRKCINFSCPLNKVSNKVREVFLSYNNNSL